MIIDNVLSLTKICCIFDKKLETDQNLISRLLAYTFKCRAKKFVVLNWVLAYSTKSCKCGAEKVVVLNWDQSVFDFSTACSINVFKLIFDIIFSDLLSL